MSAPTLLVLGVGGNVSQGILKALHAGDLEARVVTACVSPLSAGLHAGGPAYVSPLAEDPAFVPWLEDVIEREGVQGVLTGAEPVLSVLADHAEALRERTGAVVVGARPEPLRIGADKLVTARWLEQQGLPFPVTAAADDDQALDELVHRLGFPLIAKPRTGKGGEGVGVITDAAGLGLVRGSPDVVVQELLGDDDGEYTAGCVCAHDGTIAGTATLWRRLHVGTTHQARCAEFPEQRAVAEAVVKRLAPAGPCNVQMRMTARGPVPFELNVRFSGTTPMRTRLGFDEVGACVRHFVLGQPLPSVGPAREGWVLRYWNEVYAAPGAVEALEAGGSWSGAAGTIEDWGQGA